MVKNPMTTSTMMRTCMVLCLVLCFVPYFTQPPFLILLSNYRSGEFLIDRRFLCTKIIYSLPWFCSSQNNIEQVLERLSKSIRIAHHGYYMASCAHHYKQMPNEMTITHTFGNKEDNTCRIHNPTPKQPE